MKASAIYLALAIVLPAVLALPQPAESMLDGLLRDKGKGKDEGSNFAQNEGSKLISSNPWTTIANPNDQIFCASNDDCDFSSSCVMPKQCTVPDELVCRKVCVDSSPYGVPPSPI